jgi:hypothetical protein
VRFKNKREETGAKFETLKQSLLLVMSEEELHAMLLSAAGGPESSSDVRAVCGFSFVSHPSNICPSPPSGCSRLSLIREIDRTYTPGISFSDARYYLIGSLDHQGTF